ncbi:uncharacterized protein N7483_010144 [Penicillium malachiteum]|uniref:uncharacterized protein n=1 Tax=Penicillium malachiteum TaxID=1324776 RepID=UPI002549AB2F|nr:uncharacterized protein N7483_010144 [Penicillium malachiteum]KAJ5712963.1 hypothetical protein N7483_010144 [Penicillium malachiteum]
MPGCFVSSDRYIWIAWFFELPTQFKRSTSIAISQSNGWIDSFGLPILRYVPFLECFKTYGILESINECREKAIQDLIVLLIKTRDGFLLGTRGCRYECRLIIYGALTIQMQSIDLLLLKSEAPFPRLNYTSFVQSVMAFTSLAWYDSSFRYSTYGTNYTHRCPNASFASIFQNLNETVDGLELSQFTRS